MDRRTLVELTNLCLIYHDDQILVEERLWDGEKGIIFPGGHIEPGESILNSVIREMKEETGLTIRNPISCGFKDWIHDDGSRYLVLLFKTDKFSGELCSSEEGRVFWVSRDEFEHMNVIWNMKDALKIMDSADCTEMFWGIGQENGTMLS